MDYQKFKESFVERIEESVDGYVGKKCEIKLDQVDKVNRTYDALIIKPIGSDMGPSLYLQPYYEEVCAGKSMENLVDIALETIKKGIETTPSIDLSIIRDYQQIKGMLSVDVISAEDNEDLLERIPHQRIEDLAVVYRINLEVSEEKVGTILISNPMIKNYGITPEQLHDDAVHNAAIIRPVIMNTMYEALYGERPPEELSRKGLTEVPEDEAMFVATVPDKTRGAGVLVYENFLDDAAKQLGCDFYVIPSSLHEIILVKDREDICLAELKDVVKMVNDVDVEPEDRLTYSVYHYDSKNRIFELGEKFEARRDRELASSKPEKGSVRKDLREKQTVVKETITQETERKTPRTRVGEVL